MSELKDKVFTAEEQKELNKIIKEALAIKQEVKDLTEGLNEVVKHKAEILGIQPKLLRDAISAAHKGNLEDTKAHISDVEELLETAKIS